MTEQKDEIRLKELLSRFNTEEYKELIEILDRDQKRYHTEQLRIAGVVGQSEQLECDVCYQPTNNIKDDEGKRYCDSCEEL